MILDYSNYLLESRYKAENIDKKYYVWQISGKYGIGKKMAIIEIVSITGTDDTIKYKIIKRNPGGYRDFFTEKNNSDNWNIYKISLSYWKRMMAGHLLFETNDKDEALSFYENFELIKKYNL